MDSKYQQYLDDLDTVLKTESGRRLIWNILQETGAESQEFHINPSANAYWQGRRSAGNDLLNAIRKLYNGPEYEMQMRIEARARPQQTIKPDDDIYENTYE